MSQAKIPVPPGFVVLASAFDRFLHETDLEVDVEAQQKKVNHRDINSVEKYSVVIRDLIHDSRMPQDLQREIMSAYASLAKSQGQIANSIKSHKLLAISHELFYVAVRSSATAEDSSQASWAGELESYLNTTEKNLLGRVKQCWSSLFTPRAIFYRHEKKLHKAKVSVAVVVQAMVQSEIAGIVFTVHPVTKDKKQLIIEAGIGLGEAIVSGQITPDSYVAEKKPLSIIETNVSEQTRALVKNKTTGKGNEWITLGEEGKKQKLSKKEIEELSKLIVKIENHYGFPCDIEWAKEKGKFYIVQSRPITTLTDKGKKENSKPIKKNKIIMSSVFTRAHSLFYYDVDVNDNIKGSPVFPNFPKIKNIIVTAKFNPLKTITWHDMKELDEIFKDFEEDIKQDPYLFDKIKDEFYKYWKILEPYAKKEKKIDNMKELRIFYNAWVKWWSPLAFSIIVSEMNNLNKKVKDESLK